MCSSYIKYFKTEELKLEIVKNGYPRKVKITIANKSHAVKGIS